MGQRRRKRAVDPPRRIGAGGPGAFLFSTFGITRVGEVFPQAHFSRNALRTGALLAPLVRFYRIVPFPIVKPTAMMLDRWLGPEAIQYSRERDLRELIELPAAAAETDLDRAEAQGALNFLDLDDLPVALEGEPVHPESVTVVDDARQLPGFERQPDDAFVRRISAVSSSGCASIPPGRRTTSSTGI